MLKSSDLPVGTHFWAMMDGKLVMMMKDRHNDFCVCGPWECPIRENEFEVIEIVNRPAGHKADKLYY